MGRQETLFNKAKAIEGLCGARVALVVFARDGGAMQTWPVEAEAVRGIIEYQRLSLAKGKKRMRDPIPLGSPPLSGIDPSLLFTAMSQKLQSIDSMIKTLTSSSSMSDWFLDHDTAADLTSYESYLGAALPDRESPAVTSSSLSSSSSMSDWFLAAEQLGLDFTDHTQPSYESYDAAALPPPQEPPAVTSLSSWSNEPVGSVEIIADEDLPDPPIKEAIVLSDSPFLIIDDDDDGVGVEECGVGLLDSPISKGLLGFSTTPLSTLEQCNFGNFSPSSPGTYTDLALLMSDYNASFCSEERLPIPIHPSADPAVDIHDFVFF